MDDQLRGELLAMQDEDQRLRRRAMAIDGEAAAVAWQAVGEADRRHTARMRQIVAQHGWPGRSLVGEDGAHAAWLVTQHADHDLGFQRECLTLLATAVRSGEATAVDHAYLHDRVAVAEGRLLCTKGWVRRCGRYCSAAAQSPEPRHRQWRMVVKEVETGYRGGNPLRSGSGEP